MIVALFCAAMFIIIMVIYIAIVDPRDVALVAVIMVVCRVIVALFDSKDNR